MAPKSCHDIYNRFTKKQSLKCKASEKVDQPNATAIGPTLKKSHRIALEMLADKIDPRHYFFGREKKNT